MQFPRFTILTAGLAMSFAAGSARAVTVWWKADTVAGWESSVENWSQDWSPATGPVTHQFPGPGDVARMGAGTSEITITADLSVLLFRSDTGYNSVIMDGVAAPDVDLSNSVFISTPKDATAPGWTMQGGTLNTYVLTCAWGANSDSLGHFVQEGGTTSVQSLRLATGPSGQTGIYELKSGHLAAGEILFGASGDHHETVFNQTGGTATVNATLLLGYRNGDGTNADAKAVINLDGGEMTINNVDPFRFRQQGAPVYIDIDGGTLRLPGAWDFNRLTGIGNSDFRSNGESATFENLVFTPDGAGYTRIQAVTDFANVGDFDGDGDVDGVDVAEMFANFTGPGGTPSNPATDLDNDGDADGVDLGLLYTLFTGPLAPATVPEPSSLVLLGVAGLLATRRLRG